MSINILPGTPETLTQMKGQKFTPHVGEGLVYLKVVFIKPSTMQEGDPAQDVQDAPGVVLCGQLTDIQAQINKWFSEAKETYIQ